MSEELFAVSSVDLDEFSVVVVANDGDLEYAFVPFTDWLESTDQVEDFQVIDNQEQMLGVFMSYCMDFIDDGLMEESAPIIKQVVFVGDNCVVLSIEVEPEVADYIKESYPEIDDVESVVFGEAEEGEEVERDTEDMEEEDDEEFRL